MRVHRSEYGTPILFGLMLLMTAGCVDVAQETDIGAQDAIAYRNLSATVDFVGDDACFQCHESEYAGFQDHGMAHSFYPLTPQTAVEAFGSDVVVDTASGYRYRTYAEGAQYFMEEFQLDESGKKTHRLVRQMEYVVGSGTIARTYITEQDGWFYELPVTWYTNAERWDFSPGYEINNQRFDRKIADRCMACHNSYPEPMVQTNGAYKRVPSGIGCERCHGPGALHVEERLVSGDPEGDLDDSIVNPAHLDVGRQLDVCQQCHLSADVSILREGRTPYDYRPSERLESYIALFSTHGDDDGGTMGKTVEVISHADRLKRSACFTETLDTPSPLLCTTCHDPHAGFKNAGDAFFNAACMDCHGAADLGRRFEGTPAMTTHSGEANCIDCHMPKADVEEAPHSTFTDHWIRVVGRDSGKRPQPPEPIRAGHIASLRPYYERDQEGSRGTMYQGMASITLGRQEGSLDLLEEGVALIDEAAEKAEVTGEALFLKGYALQLLGRYGESMAPLEAAVTDDPGIAERLNALAQTYERLGVKRNATTQLYERTLSIQPKLADVRINYGRFLESTGDVQGAILQYRRAIKEESYNMLARYNLGTAYIQLGDDTEAERWIREALSLDPRYVPALSNLGLVYAMRGDEDVARKLFERGVEIDPNNFEALDNLGTFHLNHENELLAVRYLGRAHAARPSVVTTSSKYALALFRAGDFDAARRQANTILELAPDDATARQILIALE